MALQLRSRFLLALIVCGAALCPRTVAQLPPGFVDEVFLTGLEQAVGVAFAPDGRMFVWERTGRVWFVKDGALVSPPVLDISDEVGFWGENGLMGFALDPNFTSNGRIYLSYVVDHYDLVHAGQPGYDPTLSEPTVDTIGRITRYTVSGDPPVAIPASRFVLLGEDITHGFPILTASHGLGSLVFGSDGTLLAACGDGKSGPAASGTALAEGIITPKENVDNFRAQLVDSLSGKIVRIDRNTGDGVPSNPFFDPSAPRAPRSRVWALGLRNPFRFTLRPGTGSSSPASGKPGTLYLGDVGGALQEELSVITAGGQNLGWPIWEGLDLQPDIGQQPTANLDAPNPLFHFGQYTVTTCTQAYFDFHDLLVADALAPAPATNPCDPSQLITSAPTFVHHRPALAWTHVGELASVPIYDSSGAGASIAVGAPGSPVSGTPFSGSCAVGGVFCTSSTFPPELQGSYFQGDFGHGWIRTVRFDAADKAVSVTPFSDSTGPVVGFAMGPVDGSLYYVNFGSSGSGEVHRIRYTTADLKPHAVIEATPGYGPAPLAVVFDAGASTDPEGGALQYRWDFGDGTPTSAVENPVHYYPSEDVTAKGKITTLLFGLNPPVAEGKGSSDPEVIRDGDVPPEGSSDPTRQYDTTHYSNGASDKGVFDWLGYTFTQPRAFSAVIFQEGVHFQGWGGWWLLFAVQVRSNGVWKAVYPSLVQPPYLGTDQPNYRTFEVHFQPVVGDGIRLYGVPGGVLGFFGVGELRVLAQPLTPLTTAKTFTVKLTVTDPAGNTDSTSLQIGANNSPPVPQILLPVNYGTYSTGVPVLTPLRSKSSDAESPSSQLQCAWQVIEHNDAYAVPGRVLGGCETSTLLASAGCDGSVHWVEIVLTVTDPAGLSTSVSHYLVPDCDKNLNGTPDTEDIALLHSRDANGDGIPDEAQTDCNANGVPDLYEIFFGSGKDSDGNGVLDECEHPYEVTPYGAQTPH